MVLQTTNFSLEPNFTNICSVHNRSSSSSIISGKPSISPNNPDHYRQHLETKLRQHHLFNCYTYRTKRSEPAYKVTTSRSHIQISPNTCYTMNPYPHGTTINYNFPVVGYKSRRLYAPDPNVMTSPLVYSLPHNLRPLILQTPRKRPGDSTSDTTIGYGSTDDDDIENKVNEGYKPKKEARRGPKPLVLGQQTSVGSPTLRVFKPQKCSSERVFPGLNDIWKATVKQKNESAFRERLAYKPPHPKKKPRKASATVALKPLLAFSYCNVSFIWCCCHCKKRIVVEGPRRLELSGLYGKIEPCSCSHWICPWCYRPPLGDTIY